MQCGTARRAIEAVATGCIEDAVREDLLAHAISCPTCEERLLEALRMPEEWEIALSSRAEPPAHGLPRLAETIARADGSACWSFLPDLAARLDGELEDERARLLDAHLAACPDCEREREFLLLAHEAARDLRVEPPARLLTSLNVLADAAVRKHSRLAQLRAATAAAAAVAVVALGLALWRPSASTTEPARAVAVAPSDDAGLAITGPNLPEPLEPARLADSPAKPMAKVGGTSDFAQASLTAMNARRHSPRRGEPPAPRAAAPTSARGAERPVAPGVPAAGRSADSPTEDRAAPRDAGPLGLALEGWQRVVESLPSGPVADPPRGGPVVVDAVAVQAGSSHVEPTGYATLY